MRRLLLAAVIAGLALGAGLNLVGWPQHTPPRSEAAVNAHLSGRKAAASGPASHGDSNTSSYLSYINPNVIQGQTTRVCTTDDKLKGLVTDAVAKWNAALSGLDYEPFTDVSDVCANAHVEVIRTGEFREGEIRSCSPDTNACYDRAGQEGSRQTFPPGRRAYVIFQRDLSDTLNQSASYLTTMIHELGHALGVGHYETGCNALRDATVNPTNQPIGDHFSVMVSEGGEECGTQAVITGRDLRDFFEAYQVGAITNVTVGSNRVTVDEITGSAIVILDWGTTGIEEAAHSATHILVQRIDGTDSKGKTIWSEVDSAPLAEKGAARKAIPFTDPDGLASQYRVLGVSEALAGVSTATVKLPGEHLGLDLEQGGLSGRAGSYSFGDPTYVGDFTVTSGSGGSTVYHTASVSVSPTYCYNYSGSKIVGVTRVGQGPRASYERSCAERAWHGEI